MNHRLTCLRIEWALLLVCAIPFPLRAQTYEITPNSPQKPAAPQKGANKTAPKNQPAPAPSQSLGWGSNIQDARLARAAELALKQGNKAQALNFAQRAAQAAPNDAQLWILLGYAARLNGQYQLSVDSYSHGLRLKPGAVDGKSGLAQTYAIMGRTDEAERLLREVIAADPRRADDSLLLGEMMMKSGDLNGALNYFRRAEQVQAGVRSEVLMAIAYQRLKQFDQANRYLAMAKSRAPNNPEVERSLAGFFLETGNYDEALRALQAIRNPRPDVVAELAYIYQLQGKPVEAARLYTQAANAMPKDMGLQLSAAQAEVAVGAIEKANVFLTRAERMDPEFYRLHAIRGQIDRLQDRDADAVTEYTKVLAHMPGAPAEGPLFGIQIHMDLVDLYQNLKQTAQAHEQLEIAHTQIGALDESGPGRVPFLRLRASIAMRRGELDGAERDVNEALAINGKDPATLQLAGDVLMKLGRTDQAIESYGKILTIDPKNRYALTSLGYASRAAGRDQDAERYFRRLADNYPTLYIPYLALGDLYTARRDYAKAETNYVKAYGLNAKNPLIVAGGMNATIEAHNMDMAGVWSGRITPDMRQEPQVLREQERYLSFKGDYQQSAAVGEEAIKVLPKDRDVIVYLGYDLLNLNRYDELLKLTAAESEVLPKEPDLPLLAGYVHKHNGDLEQAREDFTKALDRDPNIVTAYVNRGYVLHDLRQPQPAAADFEAALKRDPNNGEAHLGLAYANLDLKKPQLALRQVDLAEKVLGDSQALHLIRATAYGQRRQLTKAASEYRLAIKYTPNDGALHTALAGVLYSQRHYHDAIDELDISQKLNPNDAATYALLARSWAELGDREQTLHNVQLAEETAVRTPVTSKRLGSGAAGPGRAAPGVGAAVVDAAGGTTGALGTPGASSSLGTTGGSGALGPEASGHGVPGPGMTGSGASGSGVAVPPLSGTGASGLAGIYLSTGSALSVLGDHQAAMERFSKALLVPESDRVGVRLAISELMVQQGHAEDAQRQIALGLMEAEAGETQPATGEQLIEAADIFRSLHNYELSQNYLDRAQAAGAADTSVRLGRANNYIAMGDTARAQGELAGISRDAESDPDYQFLLLEANVLRQQHQSAQALTAFAQAADAAGEDQTAEENLLLAGGDEGLRVNQRVSLLGDFSVSPIFEDTTVYVLDSKLDGPAPVPPTNAAQLPLPRSSIQTEGTAAYHLHVNRVPTVSGFFQVRNARGTISIPATNSIANRDTTDYSFNVGLNPTVHLGRNVITFNSGVQATIRRDAKSPAALNQNLFREFTYASTSSFFNVVSASGYVLHESGPFTDTNLHSSMLAGALDFRVGAPWGKTALVTGWAASDQKFTPVSIENYYTSSYIGLERKFTPRLNVRAVFEDLRAWRTVDTRSGISQAIRPAGVVDFFPARGWRVEVSSAYNRTQGFHSYDAVQNGFSVSYGIPFRREFKDQGREVPLQYPIRFSGGMQEESFFNFPGSHQQQLRPYFSISLF